MSLTTTHKVGIGVLVAMLVLAISNHKEKPAPTEYDTMYEVSDKVCEKAIIGRLKDPDSYKRIDYSFGRNTDNAKQYIADITYTATNSFGGRIKATSRCIFTADKMVWFGELK